MKILLKHGAPSWKFIWPLPRLRYRLRHGTWCAHERMTQWKIIFGEMRKVRRCLDCDWTEVA